MHGNVKLAFSSLKNSKGRTFLTILGIVIGIVSVITTISIGEGVKQQVADQVASLGPQSIVVRSGQPKADNNGLRLNASSLFPTTTEGVLSEADISVIEKTPKLRAVTPIAVSSGIAEVDGNSLSGGAIVGTNSSLPAAITQQVEFGAFFTKGEETRQVTVIGKRVAEQLFKENVPVGRTLQIRNQDFIVRGVFEEFNNEVLIPGTDLNKVVFIPYPAAKELSQGAAPIQAIVAQADDEASVDTVVEDMTLRLRNAHEGQNDFTIFTQADSLASTNQTVTLLEQLITSIASISLLVAGIGIMNIMLVSVTERTREIGIRKAIGATNAQIMSQFVIEAAVLSISGGLIGIALAILTSIGLKIFTEIDPVVSLPVILIATGASWVVGIIFGVIPAFKAARKDPIDALRHE